MPKTQIILEKTGGTAWRCVVEIGNEGYLTNEYKFSQPAQERSARGYALVEANIIISARERFTELDPLVSYVEAYRTTPQFEKGGLAGLDVTNGDTTFMLLGRSVMNGDTVAAMICRGVLDLGAAQRIELARRLNGN